MSADGMLETVRGALDELLQTGSLQRLLDNVTDDVVVRITMQPGTPISGEFHGKEGVTAYFAALNEVFEVVGLTITGILAGGDKVAVLPVERVRLRRTQQEMTLELALVFTFRDGKIARLTAIGDLSAAVEAYREPAAAP